MHLFIPLNVYRKARCANACRCLRKCLFIDSRCVRCYCVGMADRDTILAHYKASRSSRATAKALGVSAALVLEIAREEGVTAPKGKPKRSWPQQFVDECAVLYGADKTLAEIAEAVGSTAWKVRQALVWGGHEIRPSGKRRTIDREALCALFDDLGSARKAAAEMGVDYSQARKILKGSGRTLVKSRRRYSVNSEFFDDYTPESCYWAGFIAADGSVFKAARRYKRVAIRLARKDRDHLERFRRVADVTYLVHDHDRVRDDGIISYESGVCATSPEWFDALCAKFNLQERKTLVLRPPPRGVREDLLWHYVRGYFDGDGCASSAPRQIHFACGCRAFLEWVREFVGSHHAISELQGEFGLCWQFCVSGPVLRAMAPKMYANSTPDTRMDRKYSKFVSAKLIKDDHA